MGRLPIHPLRPLSDFERTSLESISRSHTEPAAHVARARILLAVSEGASFIDAARAVGRKHSKSVTKLVKRFNESSLAAVESRYYNCGKTPLYNECDRQRILQEFERTPDREVDGCVSWSLSLLRDALRRAADGLPHISTYTLWKVLHESGYTCQKDRTWCKTGEAVRKRKTGSVTVTDPDAEAKKTNRSSLHQGASVRPGSLLR